MTLEYNGKTTTQTLQPRLKVLCETLLRRGDPGLAFTVSVQAD